MTDTNTKESSNTCCLDSITDDQVRKVIRAFWRRIYPYRNDYGIELPDPIPVEFMSFMATALTWVDVKDSKIKNLEADLSITDKLLIDRIAVLSKIPPCPVHGGGCLPHYSDWIENAKNLEDEVAELKWKLTEYVWLPISSAPKDGSEILLRSPMGDVGVCYFRNDEIMKDWTWGLEKRFMKPMYWMPIPKFN